MRRRTHDESHGRTVGVVSTAQTLSPAASRLARGVTATWWYTATSVLFIQAMTLFVWFIPVLVFPAPWAPWGRVVAVTLFLAGSAIWLVATGALLLAYRRTVPRADAPEPIVLVPTDVRWTLAATLLAAVVLALATTSALLALTVVALSVVLLRWMPGVRLRVVIAVTLLLAVVWIFDRTRTVWNTPDGLALLHPYFTILLPAGAVAAMWWWDVVVALDRARGVESRLAATQERLSLASDLHDLQGHHLQVIALQLELAERMLPRDPDAAAEQVRLARASVDEARAGTRELAGRFRGVPLPDELANAADLLRAAGVKVRLEVAADAAEAPADVLGPIVRESTTNVLKHGGGKWAELSLRRDAGGWQLRVANDAGDRSTIGSGSGLVGIGERLGHRGGSLHTESGDTFVLVAVVPEEVTA
jgi:two-component system, NarL family, sensor histidine kinase DesK